MKKAGLGSSAAPNPTGTNPIAGFNTTSLKHDQHWRSGWKTSRICAVRRRARLKLFANKRSHTIPPHTHVCHSEKEARHSGDLCDWLRQNKPDSFLNNKFEPLKSSQGTRGATSTNTTLSDHSVMFLCPQQIAWIKMGWCSTASE